LLILDEATTALDPENEMAICNTLSQLRGKLTILAISHQPAVLKIADQAYRLQNGAAAQVADADLTERSDSEAVETDPDRKSQLIANPTNLQ
jgi:ATP-binding cassette subfamily C protein